MALDQVDVDKLPPDGEKEMSFLDHLEHLRWHIIRSLVSIVRVGIGVFLAANIVFDRIILGPTKDSFLTYQLLCGLGDFLCLKPGTTLDIITRDIGEQFITHIKSSFWIGLIVAFPYVFWEFWRSVKPGLYENERKAAGGMVFICSALFITGVLFGYFVISPFAVSFLSSYSVSPDILNTTTLSSFVNYMTMFTIPTGLVFELPIVVYFLAKIGLVTPEFMKMYRKHAIVIIFIAASIITPPDVITQFLIAIPLFILYEVSIIIARRQMPKT